MPPIALDAIRPADRVDHNWWETQAQRTKCSSPRKSWPSSRMLSIAVVGDAMDFVP